MSQKKTTRPDKSPGNALQKNEVVLIEGEAGNQTPWRLIHVRHRQFQEQYPISDDWQLNVAAETSDLKLPGNDGPVTCVRFTATLVKSGKVFRNASCLAPIYGLKSWETGETNAISRLYDRIGIPGAVTDLDELSAIQSMLADKNMMTVSATHVPIADMVQDGEAEAVAPIGTPKLNAQGIPNAQVTQIRRLGELRAVEIPFLESPSHASKVQQALNSGQLSPVDLAPDNHGANGHA